MNTPIPAHIKGKSAFITGQAHPADLSTLPHPPRGIIGGHRPKRGGVRGIYRAQQAKQRAGFEYQTLKTLRLSVMFLTLQIQKI